ncbi:MAG: 4-hydroxy-3-methylbut-2-enyl diphosphate reductase [Parcubacteria group bacterium]|jgi:4-hydroxy-3-methylbut-2-enyl diphosphate reductase
MKITLSQYAGFCDGVKRAYDIALKISKDKKVKKPIFVLGSLVHNNDVVRKIEKMGIGKISFDGNIDKFFSSNKRKIGTLIVTAHGIGPKFYKLAKEKNIDVIDTTCPKVIKVQRLAKLYSDRNYQVIIIGEKMHKEVKGIFEWSNEKAIIIDNEKDIKNIKLNPKKKIAIISQTTQSEDFVKKISDMIRKEYPKSTEIFDTLCLTTRDRQGEVKEMAKNNDVIIIIGSPDSANSTHLWKIAKKINSRSYFVKRAGDIKKNWFENAKKIGISAGASTPLWIIERVCNFAKKKL